jgi:hypothetical protein
MAVIEIMNPTAGVMRFYYAGAPTNDSTFLGVAPVGAILQDTTNGDLYICTVSSSTNITWDKVST